MTCNRGKWVSYLTSLPAPPHKPTHLRQFLRPSISFPSTLLLHPPLLLRNPRFLVRPSLRLKPHNNQLSGSFWGLIFLPKNAIKTHYLAAKTHKNGVKTLKNALFPLENASAEPQAQLITPETALPTPPLGVNPPTLRPDPANNSHCRTITGRSERLLTVFLPIYTV